MSKIDDIFKKGLDGKGMEYSDASWAGVEQMLATKKVGFFAQYKLLLSIAAAALCVGSIGYCMLSSNTAKNTPLASEPIIVDSATVPNQTVHTPTAHNGSTKKESQMSSPKGYDLKKGKSQQAALAYDIEYTKNQVGATQSITEVEIDKTSAEATSLASTGTLKLALESNLLTSTQGVSSQTNSQRQPIAMYNRSALQYSSSANEAMPTRAMQTPPTLSAAVYPISAVDLAQPIVDIKLSTVPKLKSPVGKSIGVYLSAFAAGMTYDKAVSYPPLVASDYANLDASRTESSINGGLRVGVKKNNWMIKTGVESWKLVEKTNYIKKSEYYAYDIEPRIADEDFSSTPRGTRVVLISEQRTDSTLVQTATRVCEGCQVQFNYVQVPLSVQYNFGKNRLSYFVEAGASAAFLRRASGVYATLPAIGIDDLEQLATSENVHNTLLQLDAGVGLKYRVLSRWGVWTSYNHSRGTKSMMRNYQQIPTTNSIRVGVEYKLW